MELIDRSMALGVQGRLLIFDSPASFTNRKAAMKNVLVTGANRGIGLEFVQQLANGCCPETENVIATCRDPDNAEDLQNIKANSKIKVHIIKLFITTESGIQNLASTVADLLGKGNDLTVLINNAAYGPAMDFEDITFAHMNEFFTVNVTAPLMITKTLLPTLSHAASRASDLEEMSCSRAAVVNISSSFGSLGYEIPEEFHDYTQRLLPYCASKAALNKLMRGVAVETSPMGILVFLLHPGWVNTDLGGPNAPTSTEESVGTLLKTMASRNKEHHGGFFGPDGHTIPW